MADLLAADEGPWQLLRVTVTAVMLEWAGFVLFTLQPVATGQPVTFDVDRRWSTVVPRSVATFVAASLQGSSSELETVDLDVAEPRRVGEIARSLLADGTVDDPAVAVALATDLAGMR